ncbi:hypothetical protein D9M69_518770 [compost metagenome]
MVEYTECQNCHPTLKRWYREMSVVFPPSDAFPVNPGSSMRLSLVNVERYAAYTFDDYAIGMCVATSMRSVVEQRARALAHDLALALMKLESNSPQVWWPDVWHTTEGSRPVP